MMFAITYSYCCTSLEFITQIMRGMNNNHLDGACRLLCVWLRVDKRKVKEEEAQSLLAGFLRKLRPFSLNQAIEKGTWVCLYIYIYIYI